jgi:hypothetical protein
MNLLKFTIIFFIVWGGVEDAIIVNGKKIKVLTERDPGKIPWKDYEVEVVIESGLKSKFKNYINKLLWEFLCFLTIIHATKSFQGGFLCQNKLHL